MNAQTASLPEINTDKRSDTNSEKDFISAKIWEVELLHHCVYIVKLHWVPYVLQTSKYSSGNKRKYYITIYWYYLVKNSFR